MYGIEKSQRNIVFLITCVLLIKEIILDLAAQIYRTTPPCNCLLSYCKRLSLYDIPSSQEENCSHSCLNQQSVQGKEIETKPQIHCKTISQLPGDPNFSK